MTVTSPSAPYFDPAHPNLEALATVPSAADVQGYRSANSAAHRADPSQLRGDGAQSRAWIVYVAFLCCFIVIGAIIAVPFLLLGGNSLEGEIAGIAIVAIVLVGSAATVASVRRSIHGTKSEGARQLTLSRFATDNGLVYRPRSAGPRYPGCLFTTNTVLPYVYDHFSTPAGRFIDFGNFHSRSKTGDGPGAHEMPNALDSWGFLAVQIDRHMPNLVLESKAWRGKGVSLPITPDPNQILHLEGDFDQYFTLYCPQQFEVDALSVITPDLMALLIDDAAPLDLEIVDDWMFFYSPKPFDMMDPAVYRRLFTILDAIAPKIVAQAGTVDNPLLGPVAAATPERPAIVVHSWGEALDVWAQPSSWHWVPASEAAGPVGDRLKQKSPVFGIALMSLFAVVIVVGAVYLDAAAHRG